MDGTCERTQPGVAHTRAAAAALASGSFELTSQAPSRTAPGDLQLTTHRVVATTVVRSPARPARVMGDAYRQVSWLAALTRHVAHRLRLPARVHKVPGSGFWGDARRLQLRGQPRL
jgi:hypothetical protein